jgi:hypothetical protein
VNGKEIGQMFKLRLIIYVYLARGFGWWISRKNTGPGFLNRLWEFGRVGGRLILMWIVIGESCFSTSRHNDPVTFPVEEQEVKMIWVWQLGW